MPESLCQQFSKWDPGNVLSAKRRHFQKQNIICGLEEKNVPQLEKREVLPTIASSCFFLREHIFKYMISKMYLYIRYQKWISPVTYLALFSCVLFSVFSSFIYLKLNKALEIIIRTNYAIMIQLYHRNIEENMLMIWRKKKQEFHPL